MKKSILFTPVMMLFVTCSFAQKYEISIAANSGLFSFEGEGTRSASAMTVYDIKQGKGYAHNPFGKSPAISYGMSAKLARVTKSRFLWGADAGYEALRSKQKIDEVFFSEYGWSLPPYRLPASGSMVLTNGFINLHGFAGRRFLAKKMHIDVTGGFDLGFCLESTEKGTAKASNGNTYTNRRSIKALDRDFRPRVQVAAGYKRMDVYLGYSFGLSNYKENYKRSGTPAPAYSRLLRFGLSYRLK